MHSPAIVMPVKQPFSGDCMQVIRQILISSQSCRQKESSQIIL